MQNKVQINLIGYGFIGSAIGNLCENNEISYNVHDLDKKYGNFNYFNNLKELVDYSEKRNKINYYIIAVPTPSNSDGTCNTLIVESILKNLNDFITEENSIILIKSTLVPLTLDRVILEYPKLNIILCPEFLRELYAKEDMYNADFVLLGINEKFNKYTNDIKDLFKIMYKHNPNITFYIKTPPECELFKYTLNNFLGLKVWYFNKIYDICEKMNINYESFKELFQLDTRLGIYGTHVPYTHGRGFSGECIYKDTKGMMKFQESIDIDNSVWREFIRENDILRAIEDNK